eukprot:CAMPEP_0172823010 /NCGR_PEP_ID=MMETSP1075-20121228/17030_1 /TAXON_ID=2916 /ORGANISM="Ceratium fusus, Strain PA161109" /LENGTH=217 /DNA_ID=CAMNT_0013664075 /DNA_START=1 /DNA_END=651 /DNA_ORIENTATION=+
MKVKSCMQTLPHCLVKPLKMTIHQAPVLAWLLGVNPVAFPPSRNKTAAESYSTPMFDGHEGANNPTNLPAENKKAPVTNRRMPANTTTRLPAEAKEHVTDVKRDLLERHGPADQVTTMMVRNLPYNMTLEMLATHVDVHGFAGCYDLIHLPHMSGSPNLGYGFVNFCSPEHAARFEIQFKSVSFRTTSTVKVCKVQSAHIQGFMNNVEFIYRTKHFN